VKTFWRWTGTIFFAFAFIFLALAGIGTSIPIWHSAKCGAEIAAPADALFRAIADDGSSASWRPELRTVTLLSGSGPTAVWQESLKNGQELRLHTVTYEEHMQFQRRAKILVRVIPFDPRLGFDGTWAFFVTGSQKTGAPTRVAINEQGHIYNPLYRFLTRYVFGYTSSIRTYITELGAKFDQTPTITCVSSG